MVLAADSLSRLLHSCNPSKYTGVGIHFEGGVYVNDVNLKDIWNNETVKNMIDENYDVIVLQESQEGCYENKDAFHEYAQKFNDAAKAADLEIVLFMNWPEEKTLG